jgi:hypothetical protein
MYTNATSELVIIIHQMKKCVIVLDDQHNDNHSCKLERFLDVSMKSTRESRMLKRTLLKLQYDITTTSTRISTIKIADLGDIDVAAFVTRDRRKKFNSSNIKIAIANTVTLKASGTGLGISAIL